MYIKNANFAYVVDTSELTEEKRRGLQNLLTDFPEVETSDSGVVVLRGGNDVVALTEGQITYLTSGSHSKVQVEEIASTLNKALVFLGVESDITVVFAFEGFTTIDKSARELSLQSHHEEARSIGAIGMGYRFVVDTEQVHGDIRIEPYLSDDTRIYYRVELQSDDKVDLAEAGIFFEKMFRLGIVNAETVAKKMFNLERGDENERVDESARS